MKLTDKRSPFPWMFVSLLLHVVVLGALFLIIADKHESIEQTRKRQIDKLSAEKIAEASEYLQRLNRQQVERNVQRLEEIEETLAKIEKEQAKKLADSTKDRPAEALANARKLAEEIERIQTELIESQKQQTPRLIKASEDLTQAVQASVGATRAKSFLNGKGGEAIKRFVEMGRDIASNTATIERVLKLQAELGEELAWLDANELQAVQQRALGAQEHSGYVNRETQGRIEWAQRDVSELPQHLKAALDDDMKGWKGTRVNKTLDRQPAHAASVKSSHPRAIAAQESAIEAHRHVKRALDQLDTDKMSQPADAQLADASESSTVQPAGISDTRRTLEDVYNHGVSVERRIAERAASIRAATISRVNDVAPAVARATVVATAPDRPKLGTGAFGKTAGNADELDDIKSQLALAVDTTDTMVHSAEGALASAVATINNTLPPNGETDSDASGGFAGGPPGAGMLSTGGGPGGGAGGREPSDGKPAARDIEAERKATMASVYPGRTIVEDANSWMFVDGWYTIGPFADGTSAGRTRRFAPETTVDLGAVYRGPDGRTLKWTYRREPRPGTSYFPDQAGNSVSYAYTYIRSPREMRVWLAVASDDASAVILNGNQRIAGPTWHETQKDNNWQFSFGEEIEGYRSALHYRGHRPAKLNKGVNSVLLRVENGPGRSGFAVYVKPAE